MEQTAYTRKLLQQLQKERLRSAVLLQATIILSIACVTLVCALAFYCNIG